MSRPSSSRSSDQKRNVLDLSHLYRSQRPNLNKRNNHKSELNWVKFSSNNVSRVAILLIVCSWSFGGIIQCLGESMVDIPLPTQNYAPCLCKGVFYQECPDWELCERINAKNARNKLKAELKADKKRLHSMLSPNPFDFHDDAHPDHVSEYPDTLSIKTNGGDIERSKSLKELGIAGADDHAFNPESGIYDVAIDKGFDRQQQLSSSSRARPLATVQRVTKHRKVYVTESPDPIIHPISLTIPVRLTPDPMLDPPKPLFKMRKYTTYENEHVTQYVPVTTTVIKPVGISEDQLI